MVGVGARFKQHLDRLQVSFIRRFDEWSNTATASFQDVGDEKKMGLTIRTWTSPYQPSPLSWYR